jgi:hypothetical protein
MVPFFDGALLSSRGRAEPAWRGMAYPAKANRCARSRLVIALIAIVTARSAAKKVSQNRFDNLDISL